MTSLDHAATVPEMAPEAATAAGLAAMPLATTLVFHTAEDFAAALQSADVEYVSLATGRFQARLTLLDLPGLRLQRAIDAPHLTRGSIAPGELVLLMPLGPTAAATVNGRPIGADDAYLLGPGSDIFAATSSELAWAGLSLTVEAAEALGIAVPAPGQFRRLPGLLARHLALLPGVRSMLSAGEGGGAVARGSAAAAGLAEDARALLASVLGGGLPEAGPQRAVQRHLRLVRQADEVLRGNLARPPRTGAICDALAVPERTLRAAFEAVHGISLHAYLRLRRLDLVRASLLRTPLRPGRVKAAALSHGFWHLGRFAAEYQARFGESPSCTMPLPGRGIGARGD
jgi:AraC family ethanolamine operon transcriptional activator